MTTRRLDGFGWLFLMFGLGMTANALWMLAGPMHWYTDLPAAVPDTGPFNPHFVRDIGCAFLSIGVALLWAGFDRRSRVPLVVVSALFLALHGLLHIYDTVSGALDHTHWWLDFPGVYLPALVMVGVAVSLVRASSAEQTD